MAYKDRYGVDASAENPAVAYDNRGIVREVAELADRTTKLQKEVFTVKDPKTGLNVEIPVLSDGRQTLDLSGDVTKWRPEVRLDGTANVETLDSFIDLVNRHKSENSAIFANLRSSEPWLRAVIDYHTLAHEAKPGRHSVYYKFPLSPEFQAWRNISGKSMAQRDFAAWVEDHIHEVVSPSEVEIKEFESVLGLKFGHPNELVRVARGITIHADLKVANIQTLQTGEVQMAYEETHTLRDSDQKPLKIPGLILVMIPMFYGGEDIRIPFRLRYERDGGSVKFRFIAFRMEQAILTALTADYETAIALTQLPGFRGTPEMA